MFRSSIARHAGVAVAAAAMFAAAVGPAAAARSCAPVTNPYPNSRYEGVPLSHIRATGVSCATARKVARRAHYKALGMTPPSSGIRRLAWNGWRVTGDLRGAHDHYVARRGSKVVRWDF
jgi:hypothetical protein